MAKVMEVKKLIHKEFSSIIETNVAVEALVTNWEGVRTPQYHLVHPGSPWLVTIFDISWFMSFTSF